MSESNGNGHVTMRSCFGMSDVGQQLIRSRRNKNKTYKRRLAKYTVNGVPPYYRPFVDHSLAAFTFQAGHVCRISRLSFESIITAGYDLHVYSYEAPTEIGALPVPAKHLDAKQILPETSLFQDANGGWEGFTNLFQFAALYEHGGLWIDSDYILLSKLPEAAVLGIEDLESSNATPLPYVLRVPARSQFSKIGLELADKYRYSQYPREKTIRMLSRESSRLKFELLPAQAFCPVSSADLDLLLEESTFSLSSVSGLHLWQLEWLRQEIAFGSGFSPGCPYEILWREFFS